MDCSRISGLLPSIEAPARKSAQIISSKRQVGSFVEWNETTRSSIISSYPSISCRQTRVTGRAPTTWYTASVNVLGNCSTGNTGFRLRTASILVRSVLCLRDLRKVLASVATGFHRFDTDDYLPVGHESVLPGDYRRIHRASVRGSERPSLLGGSQGDPPTHFWQPGGNTTDRRIRRGSQPALSRLA